MREGVIIEDITDESHADAEPVVDAEKKTPERDIDVESGAAVPSEGSGEVQEADKLACPQNDAQDSDQGNVEQAETLKQEGNALYSSGNLQEAMDKYSAALEAAPESAVERAVYLGNRAACHIKLRQFAEAAQDCSAALEVNPSYSKVLLRRSSAYEELDDLERALADAQKVLELEPGNSVAAKIVQRLQPVVNERREKLKEEMLGKLKDLGNTVLGKFGLSLDNFKADKDPNTGSYSIKFQQN